MLDPADYGLPTRYARMDESSIGGQGRPERVQFIYRFRNGREASVIRDDLSYGGSKGLWEVRDQSGGKIVGWLSEDGVAKELHRIANRTPVIRSSRGDYYTRSAYDRRQRAMREQGIRWE